VSLIGGGSQSRLWGKLIASAIGLPLAMPASAAFGPALGAALLARAAFTGGLESLQLLGNSSVAISPDPTVSLLLEQKRQRYQRHLTLFGPDA
jgi:xylulokinase